MTGSEGTLWEEKEEGMVTFVTLSFSFKSTPSKKKRDYEQKGKLKVAFFTLGRDSIVHANAMSESPVEGMGKGELEEREGATVLLDDFAVIVLSFAFVHHHFSHIHNFLAPTL